MLCCVMSVLVTVDKVNNEISCNEGDVPDVNDQNVVDVSGVYFCADAGNVADNDKDGEH